MGAEGAFGSEGTLWLLLLPNLGGNTLVPFGCKVQVPVEKKMARIRWAGCFNAKEGRKGGRRLLKLLACWCFRSDVLKSSGTFLIAWRKALITKDFQGSIDRVPLQACSSLVASLPKTFASDSLQMLLFAYLGQLSPRKKHG